MLATPAMTYADLKQRVAERAVLIKHDATLGITPLTSQPAAGKIDRAIVDGCREFVRAHNWAWLRARCEVTMDPAGTGPININSDPTRYLLPLYVESLPDAGIMWKGPDDRPGGSVRSTHMDDVAELAYIDPSSTGSPCKVAAEYSPFLGGGLQSSGGIEMRVWPKPDRAYTIGFRARLGFVPFISDHQVGQWPPVHDLTVVAYSVLELFKADRDAGDKAQAMNIQKAEMIASDSLAKSITRDNEDYRPQQIDARHSGSWSEGRAMRGYDLTTGNLLVSTTFYQ